MSVTKLDKPSQYFSDFVRLGERNYVQGSTLVQGLLDALKQWGLEPIQHLQVSCKKILNEQGYYELLDEKDPCREQKIENCASVFKVYCESNVYWITLNGIHQSVIRSIAYDEDALVKNYILNSEDKSISLPWQQQSAVLQVLIALNKKLLAKILPSESHGKWIFYKSDLDWQSIHSQNGLLTLRLKSRLGLQSALTEICLGELKVGTLFFNRPLL